MTRAYVLTCEEDGRSPWYFVHLGLGMFWTCSIKPAEARRFPTRAAASKVLVQNGKHRQGWRVIATDQIPTTVAA